MPSNIKLYSVFEVEQNVPQMRKKTYLTQFNIIKAVPHYLNWGYSPLKTNT